MTLKPTKEISMSNQIPCDNALAAMPGDMITFETDSGVITGPGGIVKTAGWQPTGNGGKIWHYETVHGVLVPYTSVIRVDKRQSSVAFPVQSHESLTAENLQLFFDMLDNLEMSRNLKTAIDCVVKGDVKNLEIAVFLIQQRIKSLKFVSPTNNGGVNLTTSEEEQNA
jgi:hypothetical protein